MTRQVARRERARSSGLALQALCALAMLLAGACSAGRRQLFAPQVMMGELFVRVHEVDVDDRRVRVKLTVENHGALAMRIDRAGLALRLPDGRFLAPLSSSSLYQVDPGEDQRIHVDFTSDEAAAHAQQATLVIGGVRFASDPYPRAVGELPLSYDPAIARQTLGAIPLPPSPAAPAPAPQPRPQPTPVSVGPGGGGPSASQATSVSVDVTTLDDATFQRLDGTALEKQIVVRLVQDGFAVVAPTWQPAVVLTVHSLGQSVLLQAYGPAGMHKREVAAVVAGKPVPAAELRLELVQKAAELVRAALGPEARSRSL
ncbi:MAG: hypothetical protein WKG00_28235 [Polyangiaceae bacterium]